jgi:hypothetical protein
MDSWAPTRLQQSNLVLSSNRHTANSGQWMAHRHTVKYSNGCEPPIELIDFEGALWRAHHQADVIRSHVATSVWGVKARRNHVKAKPPEPNRNGVLPAAAKLQNGGQHVIRSIRYTIRGLRLPLRFTHTGCSEVRQIIIFIILCSQG